LETAQQSALEPKRLKAEVVVTVSTPLSNKSMTAPLMIALVR
jgi:hypothetical protein